MVDHAVIFVRTYDYELVEGEFDRLPVRVPAAMVGWIDRRIIGTGDLDLSTRVGGLDVETDVAIVRGEVEGQVIEVRATYLLMARASTVDIFLECRSADCLPPLLIGTSWDVIRDPNVVIPGEQTFRSLSVNDLFEQALALWPEAWRGILPRREGFTTYGSVAFLPTDSEHWGEVVGRAGARRFEDALYPGDVVIASRNHLRIGRSSDAEVSRENWWGYLMLGALGGRARHLKNRLEKRIAELADDPVGKPWVSLRLVAEVQKEALIVGPDLIGAGLFGHERLISLHQDCCDVVELTALERDQLASSLENLDRYVNGLFTIAVDESQSRFALFGLVFGAFSLVFSSVAILDVLDQQIGAYVLLAVANVLMLVTVSVMVVRFRLRRRVV